METIGYALNPKPRTPLYFLQPKLSSLTTNSQKLKQTANPTSPCLESRSIEAKVDQDGNQCLAPCRFTVNSISYMLLL